MGKTEEHANAQWSTRYDCAGRPTPQRPPPHGPLVERNMDFGGDDCYQTNCAISGSGIRSRVPEPLASAYECGHRCAITPLCRSWTFVKVDMGRPNCALKRSERPNGHWSTCCDSGVPF